MGKTCGTCRFGEPAVHCPFGDHYYDFDEKTENFIHGCWEESTDTLEQRYAQLEQVAREMYKFIASTCTDEAYVIQPKFCDQLEALGVSVDD